MLWLLNGDKPRIQKATADKKKLTPCTAVAYIEVVNDTNNNQTPAHIIAQQIGGGAFYMMGTQRRLAGDNGNSLTFNVRGTKRCKWIKITLDPSDTYSVKAFRVKRGKEEMILTGQAVNIYSDQLSEIIRDLTGLETRLPKITTA